MELNHANRYTLDGVDLLMLAEKYGTPLYVYSANTIASRFKELDAAFGIRDKKIMYACKALSNVNILKLLRQLGAGLDAVSVEEIQLGQMAGFEGRDIIYTPSMVGGEEYDFGVNCGVRINVGDLGALEYMGKKHKGYPVCIRINPHVYAGGHEKISVGHEHSKFGISINQIGEIKDLIEKWDIKVEGLHMHAGSDIQSDEHYLKAIDVLFDTAELFPTISFVDIGSGFRIGYNREVGGSNLSKIAKHVNERFNKLEEKTGSKLEFLLEPGKFLVSECGYFICQVNAVKKTLIKTFLGLNSGFNHLIRPMLYEAYHEIINLSRPGNTKEIYEIVGYICETDTFAKNRLVEKAEVGDKLIFCNAGAYGYNMASNYNSKLRPPEVLIYKGEDYLIRRREKFDDLIGTLEYPELD